MRRIIAGGLAAISIALLAGTANAETLRIALHGKAAVEGFASTAERIEKNLGVDVEIVEYPAPDKDYMTKLLTELAAGNAPDLFTIPSAAEVADMVAAGYLAPVGAELASWEPYKDFVDVAKQLAVSPDGETYVMPYILGIQQIYFRRDVLEKAGISTEQPKSWAELLERAKEIKEKTGAYGLLFPAGTSWGGGAFDEGFSHLIIGSSTPQLVTDDGKFDLTSKGVLDVFQFYKDLIDADLMPVDPLLGPEPWVIPKYEMFPSGQLAATTCGSWCYIFDWGRESKNPIPNVTEVVGTWADPGQESGEFVLANLGAPWAVNAQAANLDLAKKALLETGAVENQIEAATRVGNIPSSNAVQSDPRFQALKELVPIQAAANDGTYLKQATGMSVVSEGVARATEALLRKETDAAGAQQILVDHVRQTLGDEAIK